MRTLQKTVIKLSSSISKRLDFILLRHKDFCIISNNCWGNKLYEITKREYNSPFIGLFLSSDDYLKFINNLQHYINIEMTDRHFGIVKEQYPVAVLDGCAIHFLHYKDNNEAMLKWNRRRLRLIDYIKNHNINKIIFKFCHTSNPDKKGSPATEFNALPFDRKIYFRPTETSDLLKNGCRMINAVDFFKGRLLYYSKYIRLFSGLPALKK